MPKCQNVDVIRGHAIVEIVLDATEMYPAHFGKSLVACTRTNGWLQHKECEGAFELFFYCPRDEWSILGPPYRCLFNLGSRTPCDSNPQSVPTQAMRLRRFFRVSSEVTTSPRLASVSARRSSAS